MSTAARVERRDDAVGVRGRDLRLRDDRDPAPAREHRRELVDRTGADDDVVPAVAEIDAHPLGHARGSEVELQHRVGDRVDVVRAGVDLAVCGRFVRGFARRAEAVERADRVTREQRSALPRADAVREHGYRRLQPDDGAGRAQPAAVLGVDHGAAAARDDEGFRRRAHVRDGLALELAEGGFAVLGEELGERHAGQRDDEVVGVDERPPEPLRAPAADRRLAHTHQADEDEMARLGLRRAGHGSDAR